MKYNVLRKDPIIASNPKAVRELVQDVLSSWDDDYEGLLPTVEELEQEQLRMHKEAMKQLMDEYRQKEAMKNMTRPPMPPPNTPPMSMPPPNMPLMPPPNIMPQGVINGQ